MTDEATALVDGIVEEHRYDENALIRILQNVQERLNWLPKEALERVSQMMNLPLSRIYGIASFYKAFSLEPRGAQIVKVCSGTACHVRGGARLLKSIETELGVKTGSTSADLRYTLESVRCLGCCSLAPVVTVDEETHGNVAHKDLPAILGEE